MSEGEAKIGLFIIDNTYYSPEPQVWRAVNNQGGQVLAVGVSGYFDDSHGPTYPIEGTQKIFPSQLVEGLIFGQSEAK